MAEVDSFEENILGVQDLISADTNKVDSMSDANVGELTDSLALDMSDEDLLKLSKEWTSKHEGYYPKIEKRAKVNREYYAGKENMDGIQATKRTSSNLIFEAKETFIPQALAKNPEPMVWSDNTDEGKLASNQMKAMLQFKADTMGLRGKLAIVLRLWDIEFLGIVKHGWNKKDNDFETSVKHPKNFIYDPDAYVDESGRYVGEFLGEKVRCTAKKVIAKFPKHKEYIQTKVDGKLGTKVTYVEWWTDEYCFYTFENIVLDKHKNQFFNYPVEENNTVEEQERYGLEATTVTPAKNHFAQPMMPYSCYSLFTLQEQPHDITSLTEQAIPQQDRIVERDFQITKNLRSSNNSIALSGQSFDKETSRQAATALEDGDPLLVPDGRVEQAIKRFPAPDVPDGVFKAQENDKEMLRQLYGTFGITPQQATSKTTARGQILKQDQDSSRIGGGVGERLEQLSDNIFNWWVQMMYVFYDEPHYAAIVGQGSAVEYVRIINSNINRQFVVSVAPNSMAPKDEVSEQNMALSLWQQGALDPLALFQKLNFPDPQRSAYMLMLFKTNPAQYAQMLGVPAMMQPQQQVAGGGAQVQGQQPGGLAGQPPSSGSLQEVPLNQRLTQ